MNQLPSDPADGYALGRSDAETRRLILQHQLYGPFTRQFLTAAGITAGMKVLDVGSGAGDVALLLADLAGPAGRALPMWPTRSAACCRSWSGSARSGPARSTSTRSGSPGHRGGLGAKLTLVFEVAETLVPIACFE
jgi:hypothetical protein